MSELIKMLVIAGIGLMIFVVVDMQNACNESGGVMVRQMVGYSCLHINGVTP